MAGANESDRQAQKLALIEALNEHRINTLSELRRVERIFATLGSSDLTQPMTAACTIDIMPFEVSRTSTTNTDQGCTTSTPTVFSPKSGPLPGTIPSGSPFLPAHKAPLLPSPTLTIPSSECLDEAKRRVYQDPASNRSWNFCWLVLAKVHTDRMIPTYARAQASRREMWGGRQPQPAQIDQLAAAFVEEWSAALAQLLRYWETPPTKPSS